MKLEEKNEKNWPKIQHSKNEVNGILSHHFMANKWGKMETVTDFILLDSKITVDGDCNHEINKNKNKTKKNNKKKTCSLHKKLWQT